MSNQNKKSYTWFGITYLNLDGYLPDFIYRLWKRMLCPKGIHLFDEMVSWGVYGMEHTLVCDACQLYIPIDESRIKENSDTEEEDWP